MNVVRAQATDCARWRESLAEQGAPAIWRGVIALALAFKRLEPLEKWAVAAVAGGACVAGSRIVEGVATRAR
eukprot:3588892-Pyramimonas_sp.AAC.1